MNAACRAEDLQQLQVRHFRSLLYGASAALLAVVVVLWIVGAIHPAYFPLCWPVSGSHPTMICPTGGSAPSKADVPLVLGMGALGAAFSVALNLASLKPAGVHFSLTVALSWLGHRYDFTPQVLWPIARLISYSIVRNRARHLFGSANLITEAPKLGGCFPSDISTKLPLA